MGLLAKETKSFEPIPEGMHKAICYAVYDLGTQYNDKWNKSIHKVMLSWELPEQRFEKETEEGETLDLCKSISKEYTLSLHEKAGLRKDLQGWRGKSFTKEELQGFELEKLVGVSCQLQIIHVEKNGNIYANITNIIPPAGGFDPSIQPENPKRFFSFADHGNNLPDSMPDWIRQKIYQSDEWHQGERVPPTEVPQDAPDEDIPF